MKKSVFLIILSISSLFSFGQRLILNDTLSFPERTSELCYNNLGDKLLGAENTLILFDSLDNQIWVKTFGTNGSYGSIEIKSIKFDSSNFYVSGYFRDTIEYNPGNGNLVFYPNGKKDIFILKINQNGDFLFMKTLSTSFNNAGADYYMDINDEKIYFAGSFNYTIDFDPSPNSKANLTSAGSLDGFILCLDSIGNFLWVKHLESTKNLYVHKLVFINNTLIFTGGTRGSLSVTDNNFHYTAPANSNYYPSFFGAITINQINEIKIIDGESNQYFIDLEVTLSGNMYYLLGFTDSLKLDSGKVVYKPNLKHGLVLINYDSLLNYKKSTLIFEGQDYIAGRDAYLSGDSILYLAGDAFSSLKYSLKGTIKVDSLERDVFVTKMDLLGNLKYIMFFKGKWVVPQNICKENQSIKLILPRVDSLNLDPGISNTLGKGRRTYIIDYSYGCYTHNTIETVTSCKKYEWVNGITYFESQDSIILNLMDKYGCDSVVSLDLTINNITDTSINYDG